MKTLQSYIDTYGVGIPLLLGLFVVLFLQSLQFLGVAEQTTQILGMVMFMPMAMVLLACAWLNPTTHTSGRAENGRNATYLFGVIMLSAFPALALKHMWGIEADWFYVVSFSITFTVLSGMEAFAESRGQSKKERTVYVAKVMRRWALTWFIVNIAYWALQYAESSL